MTTNRANVAVVLRNEFGRVHKPSDTARRYRADVNNRAGAAGGIPQAVSLQSAVPVLLFVAVNRFAGLRWAVVVATIWSLKLVADRRRRGLPLGVFMPIVTGAVLLRGAIGAITGSETLYFGLGIATKYLVAAVLIASAVIRRPLAARAAPFLLDLEPHMVSHRTFRPTMALVTVVAGLYYTLSATLDIWLFRRSSVEGFVVLRFLANWPLSAAALLAIVAIAHVRLTKIPGVISLTALAEARMAEYRNVS